MPHASSLFRAAAIALVVLLAGAGALSQDKQDKKEQKKSPSRMTIQAQARGTSTQMGRQFPVNIIIEEFSTADDQKALIEAFQRRGQQGIVDVLVKMKPKGRLALTGTVGNDVKYIIELPSQNGRRFRLVTDRNITFPELRQGTRSEEYSIAAIDITITPDGKGSGTLLPACKLKVNKEKQIEVEAFQNPWQLTNLLVYNR